jgi:hypothetical protein
LTQNDTINLAISGAGCLQGGGAYCTNAAGVLTVAGSSPVGATSTLAATVGGFPITYNYGAVLMLISGVGVVQLLPASAGNGLGSATPPSTLALSATSLGALGFGTFSVTNPTISFIVADNNYVDNTGSLTLSQVPAGTPAGVPALGPWGMLLLALGLAAISWRMVKRPVEQ